MLCGLISFYEQSTHLTEEPKKHLYNKNKNLYNKNKKGGTNLAVNPPQH